MEVTVIVPTYNERENIATLIKQIPYKVLVVDDSTDDTAEIAGDCGAEILKGQHKGLGQAIVDGINHAVTPIVVVMDADLSHDPKSLPAMIKPLLNGYDMTIGSRYVKGGSTVGWELSRRIISRCACLLALPVTTIKDSTSGFFAIRKEILDGIPLEGKSWKIMLETLVKAKPLRVLEVPIRFEVRRAGKSKFNKKQMVAYLKHIVSLSLYKYNKFLRFCIVGGIGALETFSITWVLTEKLGLWYMASMVIAVAFATISNFVLNSIWTFAIGKDMNDPDYEWIAYYKGNLIQKWWKHNISKKVVELLPKQKDLTILDIGCGASPLASLIGSSNYIGLDDNRRKINYMKERLPNYNYVCTKDYQNGHQSDVVMAIEVIEHLPTMMSAGGFIHLMIDYVKEGGTVIIATPDYGTKTWKFIEKIYGLLMPSAYANDHRVKFTEQALITNCETRGLKHVKTSKVLGCDLVCQFVKEGN